MTYAALIPVHNALEHAQKALACLRACQRLCEIDIHLYDDASDPETAAWCREQRGVYYLRNEEPRGYAHHLNTLALWCLRNQVDVAIVANSDTEWLPATLRRLISACDWERYAFAGPSLSAAGSGQGSDQTITRENLQQLEGERADWKTRDLRTLNGAFFAFDPLACLRYGFFDERFGRGSAEEEEWMLRVGELSGRRGVHVRSAVVFHHKHASFKAADVDSEKLWRGNADELKRKRAAGETHNLLTYPREWPERKGA